MSKVRFMRGDEVLAECEAENGKTILEVGVTNGVPMHYGCCHDACNKCAYQIRAGIENILHKRREEGREFKYPPWVRTCQAEIQGDVDVTV